MFPTQDAQDWADRLERFEHLDITVRQFCLDEGVSQASYYYWRRKLRCGTSVIDEVPTVSVAKFLPVSLPANAQPQPRSVMTVDLPGGIRIRFEVPAGNEAPNSESSRS